MPIPTPPATVNAPVSQLVAWVVFVTFIGKSVITPLFLAKLLYVWIENDPFVPKTSPKINDEETFPMPEPIEIDGPL